MERCRPQLSSVTAQSWSLIRVGTGLDGSRDCPDTAPDIVAGDHPDTSENISEVPTCVSDRLDSFDYKFSMAADDVLGQSRGEDAGVLAKISTRVVADQVEDPDHDVERALRIGACELAGENRVQRFVHLVIEVD